MKLDFDWVEVTDFKAYKGTHKFDLTRFADGSLHFMRGRNQLGKRLGSNGSGKSTILCDAMTWCFYGQTAAGLKNPDVKPWHFKGKTMVRVCVYRGKDKSIIARTINPNGQTINGKEAGAGDIERLLGMGLDLFINTVALAQGRPLFFDLEPKGKMQLFVDALDLDRWDARAKAASDRVRTLTTEIARLDGEADGLRRALKTIEGLQDDEGTKADEWDDDYTKRMKSAKKELAKCEAELERVTKAQGKADNALDAAEIELRHYGREFEKASERVGLARAAVQADADKLLGLKGQLLAARAKLRDLGEGDTCEMCGQALKGTALVKHRRELKQRVRDLDESIYPDKDLVDEFDSATDWLNACRANVLEYKKKADDARDLLDTLDRQASAFRGAHDGFTEILGRREAETNPHRAQLRALKAEHKKVNGTIADCIDDKRANEKKLNRAAYWVKGFKDIRLYVLEEIMAELQLATNAMLDEAGLVGWDVKYEVERETARGTTQRGLTILVKSPQSEGHVKWESWSGGEAQRLRVVGALALSEVLLNHAGIEPSLEVLDEPTQHLSPEGVRDLCEYLSDRAVRLNRQIWYVDQQAIESRHFASVTTIKHDKAGAHIVLQGDPA